MTSINVGKSVQRSDASGYKQMAWALINDALGSYHSYHSSDLRRCLIMRDIRGKTGQARSDSIARIERKLRDEADIADRWIGGAEARYPFWLAAAWLGWDADTLADRLRDSRTGWNLLVQAATNPKNVNKPESDRVADYLSSR